MSATENRPRFQFGLSSLLWVVTGAAILCSAEKTCPEAFWLLSSLVLAATALFVAAIVVVDVVQWIRRREADGGTLSDKVRALLRSRHYWLGFSFVLPITICLNAIPYGFSYGSYRTDGFEVAGWPLYFWECGGFAPSMHFDYLFLLIDMLVAIGLAMAVGISFRDGVGPFLIRARVLVHRMRTWPREDDD
jgi:hypothetical protein